MTPICWMATSSYRMVSCDTQILYFLCPAIAACTMLFHQQLHLFSISKFSKLVAAAQGVIPPTSHDLSETSVRQTTRLLSPSQIPVSRSERFQSTIPRVRQSEQWCVRAFQFKQLNFRLPNLKQQINVCLARNKKKNTDFGFWKFVNKFTTITNCGVGLSVTLSLRIIFFFGLVNLTLVQIIMRGRQNSHYNRRYRFLRSSVTRTWYTTVISWALLSTFEWIWAIRCIG